MKIVRKVGDNGQVTIPKEIRDVMDIEDGDIIEFDIVAVHVRKDEPKKSKRRQAAHYERRDLPRDDGVPA